MSVDDFFDRLATENPAITEVSPEVDPPFILAGNVYRARTRLGLTQAQLAQHVGVRQPRIAEIERGDANPRLDTIARVANALGVSVSALLDGEPGEHAHEQPPSPPDRYSGETLDVAPPHAVTRSPRGGRGAPAASNERRASRRSAA